MKIELKQIVDQLTEALSLGEGFKIAACFGDDDKENIESWIVVKVLEDGTLLPQSNMRFKNIKEMFDKYSKELANHSVRKTLEEVFGTENLTE